MTFGTLNALKVTFRALNVSKVTFRASRVGGGIGLQMLPVLGTDGPVEEAAPAAAALGEASS